MLLTIYLIGAAVCLGIYAFFVVWSLIRKEVNASDVPWIAPIAGAVTLLWPFVVLLLLYDRVRQLWYRIST